MSWWITFADAARLLAAGQPLPPNFQVGAVCVFSYWLMGLETPRLLEMADGDAVAFLLLKEEYDAARAGEPPVEGEARRRARRLAEVMESARLYR